MGPLHRPWILALCLLASCSHDSGSTRPAPPVTGLQLLSISVPDFGSWEANRPIAFDFDRPIDLASVSSSSIRIQTSFGAPAAGTFAAATIDADGDGVPERTDESAIVFFPRCPLADDLSDAGFTPGERYLIRLPGADSGEDPASLVCSLSGEKLAHTVVHAFETVADPARTLFDEKPGAPPQPLLRAPGAGAGPGCHLELGGDPSNQVFFEAASPGRPPGGFTAPLNLFADPATRVAFVAVFDQPIDPRPENLARLRLEYSATLAPPAWRALETRAVLAANCRPEGVAVRLVPLGTFPPGGAVRAVIDGGFRDVVGEATAVAGAEFALTEVATVAFTSLAPADAIADGIREEFDFGPESPLSFADPVAPLDALPALWGEGELRANPALVQLPPELQEFDWVVSSFEIFVFDTTATQVPGGPGGVRTIVQDTIGGFVRVRNLLVQPGGELRVRGPNPMVLLASGSVTIHGVIDASGLDAVDVVASDVNAGIGAQGVAGGGAGGSGRLGADARGGNASGAFGGGGGGGGGETGFASGQLNEAARRGGGGGGGRFARDQGLLVAEPGGDGGVGSTGAESGLTPAPGGAAGADVFTDGDPANDFFGIEPVVDANGVVIARRQGELAGIHAGAGGGSGGDTIAADSFPPPPFAELVTEGCGGGGGGGAVMIRANGPIVFGFEGEIRANGGRGGRRFGGTTRPGAYGGSGSGGHVILESSEAIDLGSFAFPVIPRVQAIGGPRIVLPPSSRGAGGAGGPGVIQLHVPHPERPPGHPDSNLLLPPEALDDPDPLAAVCQPRPVVLYPAGGSRSRAFSRWIPLGAAGEENGVGLARVVALAFDGIETAPGVDEGKVVTSGGRVAEPAPLLGPALLAQPGIELQPGGTSLALSGAVLAPLRASGQPISPDVHLRTPALLEGFTLRLANVQDPGRRSELSIAAARYDDAASTLTLVVDGDGTLEDDVAELGGAESVELTLVPRFFRVRLGAEGADLLPDSHSVRILFQGAADDGTGRPDEVNPLVDWTGDVSRFGALAPGALDFVRFLVELDLDVHEDGFDPETETLALESLHFSMRF